MKNKPALPFQPAGFRPWNSPLTGLVSAFICLCLCLLIALFFLLYTSVKVSPPAAASPSGKSASHALPSLPQPSGPSPSKSLSSLLDGPKSMNVNQSFITALSNFSKAPVQSLQIISQSTADPDYNTPAKLLQYPAGAWEFTFKLDKKAGTFSYQELMDGEQLSLEKKSGVLWSDDGMGKRKVKAGMLTQPPYSFSRVKSLEELPFLFLQPSYTVSLQTSPEAVGPKGCKMLRVTPTRPIKGSTDATGQELPREILLWITPGDQPSLKAARYFWISTLPEGPVYTVSQVNFQ